MEKKENEKKLENKENEKKVENKDEKKVSYLENKC